MNKNIVRFFCLISLIAVFNLSLSVPSFAQASSSISKSSTKISESLNSKISRSSEELIISIWLSDIDAQALEEEVKKSCGVNKESLLTYQETHFYNEIDTISRIYDNRNEDRYNSDIFRTYLERSKESREQEKALTDLYIQEKRNISKKLHSHNNEKFVNELGTDIEVLFKSDFAPLIIAKINSEKVKSVSEIKSVSHMDLCNDSSFSFFSDPDPLENLTITLEDLNSLHKIDRMHSDLGLYGAGVNIGMIDVGNFSSSNTELPSNRFHVIDTPSSTSHATAMSRILAGTSGIASQANVYSANVESGLTSEFISSIEDILSLDENISLINVSAGFCVPSANHFPDGKSITDYIYPDSDRYADYIIHHYGITMVAAAGNYTGDESESQYICSPASSAGAIAVGAYNDMNTSNETDDVIEPMSCSLYLSCRKPEIVAPANALGFKGTSVSTAFTSGVIALLFELRPSLAVYPECVKAILSASCQRKVQTIIGSELMNDGITSPQGSGAFSPMLSAIITGQGNYGVYEFCDDQTSKSIRITQPAYYSSGINFSTAWLKYNTLLPSDYVLSMGLQDFNVSIKQNGVSIGTSSLSSSPLEMIYISPSSTSNEYTMFIECSTPTPYPLSIGYAWSNNKNRFQYNQENEGVFYLKNLASGYYLDLDTATLNNTQTSYTGNNNQLWLFQKNTSNSDFKLKSCVGLLGNIDSGAGMAYNNINAIVSSSSSSNINILKNSNGSVTITKVINGVTYALGSYNDSISLNSSITWSPLGSIAKDQQSWLLEKYAYQRGDVELDGDVDAADSRYALRHATGLNSYTNLQEYLGDVNGDGATNAADANIIFDMATGLL